MNQEAHRQWKMAANRQTPLKTGLRSADRLDAISDSIDTPTAGSIENISRNLGSISQETPLPPSPQLYRTFDLSRLQQLLSKYIKEDSETGVQNTVELIKDLPKPSNQDELDLITESNIFTTLDQANSFLKKKTPSPPAIPQPNPLPCPQPHQTPNLIKTPRIDISNWDGDTISFFPWVSRALTLINQTNCNEIAKIHLLLNALPEDKKLFLQNIENWEDFKEKLLKEFGNIRMFNKIMTEKLENLPACKYKVEIVHTLAPEVQTFRSIVSIINKYYPDKNIEVKMYSEHLNQVISRKLPPADIDKYERKEAKFHISNPSATPAEVFFFLHDHIMNLKEIYATSVREYDYPETPIKNLQTTNPNSKPHRPKYNCHICANLKLDNRHYPLSRICQARCLPSEEIISILTKLKCCFLCLFVHKDGKPCESTNLSGQSKQCRQGCQHQGQFLNWTICHHKIQNRPVVSISKITANSAIPQVEKVQCGGTQLGIQYDGGCGFSLITTTALQKINPKFVTIGNTKKIRVITFAANSGKVLSYTEVKLKIGDTVLKLHSYDGELSGFPVINIPVPEVWKPKFKENLQLPTRIDILLGYDNLGAFPDTVAKLGTGLRLFRSNITLKFGLHGPIFLKNNKNPQLTCINKISTACEISEQFNLVAAAENILDPGLEKKLESKRKIIGIENILKNTVINKQDQKVTVTYSCNEDKLENLGDNFLGSGKRIQKLYEKATKLPTVDAELDKYIQNQVEVEPLTAKNPGGDIAQNSTCHIPGLEIKLQNIQFQSTLPKHHEGVDAVKRIICNIKKTISKSIPLPSKIKMNDKLVSETEDIHPPINQQLQRWNNVVWKGQRVTPKIGDLVLIKKQTTSQTIKPYQHHHTPTTKSSNQSIKEIKNTLKSS